MKLEKLMFETKLEIIFIRHDDAWHKMTEISFKFEPKM